MIMKNVIHLAVTLCLAVAAFGCTHGTQFATPPGFVAIDDDAYDFRATNADGVVLAVRAMDNDPSGDLAFWSGAIDRRLRQHYDAVDVIEVEAESGRDLDIDELATRLSEATNLRVAVESVPAGTIADDAQPLVDAR